MQARSSTEFGDGWAVNPDECEPKEPGPVNPCLDPPDPGSGSKESGSGSRKSGSGSRERRSEERQMEIQEESTDICDVLLDPFGKLTHCLPNY